MAHFGVYPMPVPGGQGYVLDVQADLLSGLATRVVVPLLPEREAPPAISDLNPVFEIGGERHVMITQAIASIPKRVLKHEVMSLASQGDSIGRALDVLLIGY